MILASFQTRTINKVGIVGAGQMGLGIAANALAAGLSVILIEEFPQAIKSAKLKIPVLLEQFKSTFSNLNIEETVSNILFSDDLSALKPCHLIIEAIPEKIDLKINLYQKIIDVVSDQTIIATNTSSFPITDLSDHISYPDRFVGIHFMNPVSVMKLVELIPGDKTSPEVLGLAKNFIAQLKKIVVISKDQPGFIVNRLLIPMINQAIYALETGVSTKEDIDTAMKLGAGFPMGPLKLADFIGLDTCLSILETLDEHWPNQGYKPSELLKKYVEKKRLGKKTGEGFYLYQTKA
jgi:3-hydroxybutyryl-CoA dehydrogenase